MVQTICRQYLHTLELLHQTSRLLLTRCSSRVALNQTKLGCDDDFSAAKPWLQLPHRFMVPKIGTLWRMPFLMASGKPIVHNVMKDFEQFGPIFRDKVGLNLFPLCKRYRNIDWELQNNSINLF